MFPFKLQTKTKEKEEVINLNKMEEERVDKLNQRHLEEMTFVQSGAVWDRGGRIGSARHPGSALYLSGGRWLWRMGLLLTLWPPTGVDFSLEFLRYIWGVNRMLTTKNAPQEPQR